MTLENPRLYDTYDKALTKRLEERLIQSDIEPQFTNNAISVLRKRYFSKDEAGNTIEDTKGLLARVAANIAYPEIHYGASEDQAFETAKTFYEMMAKREFMPNSPTLMNAGRALQQLSACFVLPIEDSMKSIFMGVYNTSQIHTTGGGTGFSFSRIRMKNDYVSSTFGRASGPVSFLKAYNEATTAVNQGGFRRGANMGILRVDHPDILEFIYVKEEEGVLPRFNLSVAVTDEFMKAVREGRNYLVYNPRSNKRFELTIEDIVRQKNCVAEGLLSSEKELSVIIAEDNKTVIAQIPTKRDFEQNVLEVRQIKIGEVDDKGRITYNAKKVFDEITALAHKKGDPGIVFLDIMNRYNPTPHVGEIESTNPCGEQPLLPYEACNLGSINLGLMIKTLNGKTEIDYEKLKVTTINAVHFLDNVIDMSKFPLEEITELAHGNRKIGLGPMGFADMLLKLRIPYDSEEGITTAREIMSFIRKEAREASREIAERRGVFPNFEGSIYDDNNPNNRFRNAAITTGAPTGTVSIISGASSGIEPLFDVYFTHTDADKIVRYFFNQNLVDELERLGINKEKVEEDLKSGKKFKELSYIPDETKSVFVTANEILTEMHVRMQAAFQENTDSSISKTINMPNQASIEDVQKAYLLAYDLGCKGITIYRDGSREQQVLDSLAKKKKTELPLGVSVDDGYLVPRKRPRKVSGNTTEIETGCGNLFVTVNKDENDRIFEVFAALGKAGGCTSALTEGVGRMISYGLRVGGDPEAIVGQLTSIRCQKPYGLGPNGTLSCIDAMSKVLAEEYGLDINQIKPGYDSADFESPVNKSRLENLAENLTSGACPQCGGTLRITEGCRGGICTDPLCGYSSCS